VLGEEPPCGVDVRGRHMEEAHRRHVENMTRCGA
jgi:hypothetical protein